MICKIALLREKRKLTQAQLAAACGVSQQGISKIETGNSDPSCSLAFKIAKTLGCTIDELFDDGKENKKCL
ncbi:helix-turn-helix transcriptional regulator [Intestinibacillus sp. Marseille-P6563]|uniref:helix-turn-helix transcriptional regulator n=1 Tax=Intestinibacillus sp. Marseille-P6563 TaxID=2364792 RepID=UPI000F06B6E6|nr:helix-turn-helix transcriptional regulator [Intestinibacillus sp. Marseille-P6563]